LSADDHTGSLIVLEGQSPDQVPPFVNVGMDADLFGQSEHGGLAGDNPDTEMLDMEHVNSSRSGGGTKHPVFSDVSPLIENFIAGDEDVNKFLAQTQAIGQRLAVREQALGNINVDHQPEASSAVGSVAEGQNITDYKSNISASDPVLPNARSGKGDEVPNLKSGNVNPAARRNRDYSRKISDSNL
jgi:hypothetical protein